MLFCCRIPKPWDSACPTPLPTVLLLLFISRPWSSGPELLNLWLRCSNPRCGWHLRVVWKRCEHHGIKSGVCSSSTHLFSPKTRILPGNIFANICCSQWHCSLALLGCSGSLFVYIQSVCVSIYLYIYARGWPCQTCFKDRSGLLKIFYMMIILYVTFTERHIETLKYKQCY